MVNIENSSHTKKYMTAQKWTIFTSCLQHTLFNKWRKVNEQTEHEKTVHAMMMSLHEEGQLLACVREKYGPFNFKWKFHSVRIFHCLVPIYRPQILATKKLASHWAKSALSQSKRRQTMSQSVLRAGNHNWFCNLPLTGLNVTQTSLHKN